MLLSQFSLSVKWLKYLEHYQIDLLFSRVLCLLSQGKTMSGKVFELSVCRSEATHNTYAPIQG